jgi:DNA-binding IclR family transcriptional regulator
MATLQTLDRGLAALSVISQRAAGMTVAELADELEVHRAICYRIVNTLEAHGLVTRTEDGRIRLGAGAAVLAARFEPQLLRSTGPVLRRLAEQTEATAHLSMAQGADCVVVRVVEPDDSAIRVSYRVGSRHPLTRGAAGIAILAAGPERAGDDVRVTTARRLGYAVTQGELERGAIGIAASVVRAGDPVATPGVSVGVVAIDGLDVERVAAAVVSAAAELGTVATS